MGDRPTTSKTNWCVSFALSSLPWKGQLQAAASNRRRPSLVGSLLAPLNSCFTWDSSVILTQHISTSYCWYLIRIWWYLDVLNTYCLLKPVAPPGFQANIQKGAHGTCGTCGFGSALPVRGNLVNASPISFGVVEPSWTRWELHWIGWSSF